MKKTFLLLGLLLFSLMSFAQEHKEPNDVTVSAKTLRSYVGKYELGPGAVLDVTANEGQIFVQLTGQSKFEIFPSSATEFYLKVVEAKVVFHKDDKGAVVSLTLYQNGRDILGTKVE